MRAILLPVSLVLSLGCKPASAKDQPAKPAPAAKGTPASGGPNQSLPEPSQDDRKVWFEWLQKTHPATLEKVTCHCCRKSLMQCYKDMGDPSAPHRCPYGCGICFNEGRDLLSMKRAGKSDDEVKAFIDSKYKIEHPGHP